MSGPGQAERVLGDAPIRRVLFYGKSMSRTRCSGALVSALREHGLEVRWRNLSTWRRWVGRDVSLKLARREFHRYRPDLVFVFFRDLPQTLLAEFRRTARVVIWCEEALDNPDTSLIEYFAQADLVSMSNPARFPWLREHGLDNMIFQMSGFSSDYHQRVPTRGFRRDIAFIGGPGRRGQRAEFLARVSERFDTEIYGHNWDRWTGPFPQLRVRGPVRPRGYARVCADSRIVLGINEVNDDVGYFSNRTFLTLACGGFHMTHYVPQLERVFKNGEHLVWYHDLDEAMERIAEWLRRPEDRARVAANGHALVANHHRYFHRVSRVLDHLRGNRTVDMVWDEALQPADESRALGDGGRR